MSAAPASSKLILLVDDEESLLGLWDLVVKGEGFRTALAGDGLEALRKIAELKPDLIVLDFMLPLMGGYEVLCELPGRGYGDIPVVVVTGRHMDDQSIEVVRRQPNVKDFLPKPVHPDKIAEVLHRVLGTVSVRSPRDKPASGGGG